MVFVALSLGSNLGDRESNVASMERELGAILKDARTSPLMETEPVGVDGQPSYLNKIITGYYDDTPHALLAACQSIESALSRVRPYPKAPRTADIDILLFGDMEINDDDLTIPHPEIVNRRFCIEGLMRIDPKIVVPAIGKIDKLYENMCAGTSAQNIFYRL